MPVPSKHFYSRCDSEGSDGTDSTEKRWPSPKFKSDIEVPPSELSEPLSAPLSGYSQPKTTSSGLKPPLLRPKTGRVRPIQTRFTASLIKLQDRWQQADFPSAKQVLLSNRSSEDLSAAAALISLPTAMNDKCHTWVESISDSNRPAPDSVKVTRREVRLVDYSPSSNSTCSSNLSKLVAPVTSRNLMQLGNQPSAKQAGPCFESDCERPISKILASRPPPSSENTPCCTTVVRSLSFDEGKECVIKSAKLAVVGKTSTKILPAPRALRVGTTASQTSPSHNRAGMLAAPRPGRTGESTSRKLQVSPFSTPTLLSVNVVVPEPLGTCGRPPTFVVCSHPTPHTCNNCLICTRDCRVNTSSKIAH